MQILSFKVKKSSVLHKVFNKQENTRVKKIPKRGFFNCQADFDDYFAAGDYYLLSFALQQCSMRTHNH